MKRKTFKHPTAAPAAPASLKESLTASVSPPVMINVRAAKDQLSSLLEQAATGHEIVITSDGQPKAKLVPVKPDRRAFRVDWALLRSVKPKPRSKTADEIVREDRDGRP